jgi:hypothetical protein
MNRLPLLSIALLVGLGITAPADDKPKKDDLARFQGKWTGKTGRDGAFFSTMTIKGDICSFDNVRQNGEKIGYTSKIEVNEHARPHKTIDQTDIVRYGGSGIGPDHIFGIYEFIDDNTIKICNGFDERPTEFKNGNGGPPIVFTLKRETTDDKAK